jgi:hypothetical protein
VHSNFKQRTKSGAWQPYVRMCANTSVASGLFRSGVIEIA